MVNNPACCVLPLCGKTQLPRVQEFVSNFRHSIGPTGPGRDRFTAVTNCSTMKRSFKIQAVCVARGRPVSGSGYTDGQNFYGKRGCSDMQAEGCSRQLKRLLRMTRRPVDRDQEYYHRDFDSVLVLDINHDDVTTVCVLYRLQCYPHLQQLCNSCCPFLFGLTDVSYRK